MESIRSSYQRSNSSRVGSPTKESSQDKDMLDPSKYSNLEDMLGSLAQFAANKSHAVLRLEQELARKAEEIQQLEDEVQRSWTASQKVRGALLLCAFCFPSRRTSGQQSCPLARQPPSPSSPP